MERLKGLLSHVDPHMTLGQLMGRLVREGLDRHDPARPPRGRRTAGGRDAGAEQTSAAKTPAASARGAASAAKQEVSDSAAPSAAKVSAQPGDEAASPLQADRGPERPDTSAATPAGDTTSAPKTRRHSLQAVACTKSAAPPQADTAPLDDPRIVSLPLSTFMLLR